MLRFVPLIVVQDNPLKEITKATLEIGSSAIFISPFHPSSDSYLLWTGGLTVSEKMLQASYLVLSP
jgi:hypothetical protein